MAYSARMSSSIHFRPAVGPYAYRMPGAAPVVAPAPSLANIEAENYKNLGNEYRKQRQFGLSAQAYEAAIRVNPYYTDAYYNYAQLMSLAGNVPKAIILMRQLLMVNPNDHDARVTLGEYHERVGQHSEAKRRYMEVLNVQPDFDPARRRLDYLLYLDQMRYEPQTAQQLIKVRYREVVHKARELLNQYYTIHNPNPVKRQLSQTVPIVFESTQKVDDAANIAEYDVRRGVMRVQPCMLFSTPNVVGAYIAHELNHALDGDPQTSIHEEQDGYRELARFWSIYQGADNEPNLDRAMALYQKSPDLLDAEVRRVYSIRQPNLPEKTPGHGMPANTALGRASQMYETRAALLNQEQLKKVLALKQGQLLR